MQNSKQINHIVILRVIAIILVVLAHATRDTTLSNAHMYSPLITPWWETNLKHYIYSFHMPLFFWISGFVFYYSSVELSKDTYLSKKITNKIKRLLLPMYTTSFLILLPTIYFMGHINGSALTQIKYFVLGSNNDHLWFLKTLFIIFVIIIPIYHYKKSDNKVFYFLVFIVWVTLYLFKSHIPSIFLAPLKYFPFFMLGILSRKYEKLISQRNIFVGFLLFFSLHLVFIFNNTLLTDLIRGLSYYLIAFVGIYFMYYFSKILSDFIASNRFWVTMYKIDNASYSIYLFHVSFLYLILFLDYKLQINIPILRVSMSFFIGLLLSYYVFIFFSKNKIISYLFGIKYNNN